MTEYNEIARAIRIATAHNQLGITRGRRWRRAKTIKKWRLIDLLAHTQEAWRQSLGLESRPYHNHAKELMSYPVEHLQSMWEAQVRHTLTGQHPRQRKESDPFNPDLWSRKLYGDFKKQTVFGRLTREPRK